MAKGKAARVQTPRSSHGDFEPAADRLDPIDHLERQATSRVPELVPIRYGRMLVSPLTFYRGAALIMAADLAKTPSSGLRAQLCGDAHLSNFGVFASPERRLVFDINDFDETLPGPWEWDVKRLAASFAAAGRENGYKLKERQRIVVGGVAAYRKAMAGFAGMRNLDVWYARMEIEDRLSELSKLTTKRMLKRTEAALAKARTKDSMQVFSKLTHEVDGEPRIISDPPLIEPFAELATGIEGQKLMESLHDILRSYRSTLQHDRRLLLEDFRMVDVARKVVGVGSVGTRAYIALLLGRENSRSPVPAAQGGAGIGARGVRRQERRPQLRRARRERPAPHAGLERHLPRLVPRDERASTAGSAISTAVSSRTGRAPSRSSR